MRILYTASEALPYAASGGLADVAGSLPAALCKAGHDCRVVLPLYKSVKPELRKDLRFLMNFTVDVGWRKQYCGVFEGHANNVTYYLLDTNITTQETVFTASMTTASALFSSPVR